MNNLMSHCGLVDARIRASNKDLPALEKVQTTFEKNSKAVFNSPILCLWTQLQSQLACAYLYFSYDLDVWVLFNFHHRTFQN